MKLNFSLGQQMCILVKDGQVSNVLRKFTIQPYFF